MRNFKLFLLLICLVFINFSNFVAGAQGMDSKKTFALFAGVLSWQSKNLSSFEKKNRKDNELYELLKANGVPEKQMILLKDEKATLKNIKASFDKITSQLADDSTFIFYYAGHGVKREGNIYFANYDIDTNNPAETGFSLNDFSAYLAGKCRSRFIMLFADCCYSGGLKDAAETLAKKGKFATALTSSIASNASTGNWTFSQTIIDSFSGLDVSDRNGDGIVSMRDMTDEVFDAMKFREEQLYCCHGNIPDDYVIAKVKKRATENSSEYRSYVHVLKDGRLQTARVIGIENDKLKCEFYYYSDKESMLIPRSEVKSIAFDKYPAGKEIYALWGTSLYKAKILKVDDIFHYITYPGWGAEWDEWITYNRISLYDIPVEASDGKAWYPAIVLKQEGNKYYIHYLEYDSSWNTWLSKENIKFGSEEKSDDKNINRKVMVSWNNKWFPAVILKQEKDKFLVHYEGYDSSWDEWVTEDRIKF